MASLSAADNDTRATASSTVNDLPQQTMTQEYQIFILAGIGHKYQSSTVYFNN